jgi:predicted membrane-bound spermidine synthase
MPRGAFYLVFVASGFAGLIYESIWTHYLKLFLGHAAYAQSLVLAVFMGGLAAGAWLCARVSRRLANPLRAYALIEAVIGALALLFHGLFVLATDWAYASLFPALGGEGLVLAAKIALCALLIAPQSLLLGMTFPLMSAGLARAHRATAGESVAMLYFSNSLGAALGVLASGFVMIAALGLPGTLTAAGLLNIGIAAAVWLLAGPEPRPAIQPQLDAERGRTVTLLLATAFFTGLASFVYEISWIRMLSLVLGASTHSFELMLSTFILGLALGGLAVRRRVDSTPSPERLLGAVQIAMALAALATLPLYDFTFSLMEALMMGLARSETGYLFFNVAGAAIAGLMMLPATIFAGMTLPLLTAAMLRRGAGESAIGQIYAANTLGAIAGVVLAVHAGLPLLGLKGALIAGGLVDAALGLLLLHFFAGKRSLRFALAGCALLFLAVTFGVQLDANKMTAGVFRHGELALSRDAEVLFKKDGKTATVHLVRYPEATSLRTNGKSDGSINLDPAGERGTDEITMVLTGALPLALKPDARSAAVIGIGTGLTTHTLLQSLDIERVETIEIEPAMAEASRGFLPRNSGAFADPRGAILIDDAKAFFAANRRRYDVIVSEPSNPWVSGVAGLFTREFYRRIRGHLAEGGLLVQWFQLYEVDPSLVASVMRALGEEFPHYAVFAPSDHDLLIVAGEAEIPLPAQARVFEHPGVAKELWTVHILTAGDFDARYIGNRATLEPLFASYGMPANSDYAPVLDLNAARHRFMEKSASSIVALLNMDVPALELLEPSRSRRPPNPLFAGAYAFERIENTRLAWYARNFLLGARSPEPDAVPAQLQKDLELMKLRLIDCREPRELDVWLDSALRVARSVNPYLSADDAAAVWLRTARTPCFAGLYEFQKTWLALFRAVGARDSARMAELAARLLGSERPYGSEARQYLLMAAMAGYIAEREPERALELWRTHAKAIARAAATPAFRLLRCHAQNDPRACADDFSVYDER